MRSWFAANESDPSWRIIENKIAKIQSELDVANMLFTSDAGNTKY